MKKLAVMQPYFFPYLGYFQLAYAVDEFVFLDDVTFIKGGYINRNSLLLGGQAHRFTIPVRDISSFRPIRDHHYLDSSQKFLDLLRHAYQKAPQFQQVFDLVAGVLACVDQSVSSVNAASVMASFRYIGIERPFLFSSQLDPEPIQSGVDRVIHLCAERKASIYVNAEGGRALYDPQRFVANSLSLGFIDSSFPEYGQKAPAFVPGLSMIDVLMWNSPQQVVDMLRQCSVVYPASES